MMMLLRKLRLLFLLTVLTGPLLAAAGPPSEVRITIENPSSFDRIAEPVTCGVPLKRRFARRVEDLVLLDASRHEVPVQVEATARYADGSPRWVLLDFQPDLAASTHSELRLTVGKRDAAPGVRVVCSLANGVAEVDTGAAAFRIDTRRFRLLDSVKVDGADLLTQGSPGAGIVLEDATGNRFTADASVTEAAFEATGPIRATLCVRGRLGPAERDPPLVDFTCRLLFYAGRPEVRVFFTLHNPAAHHHPGNIWDLGSGGSVLIESFSLELPLAAGEAWKSLCPRPEGASPAERLKLYQDSSGGENWRSANHVNREYRIPVTFRGYRVHEGTEQVAAGHRVDGWLLACSERGRVGVAVREFWQNFPKALECDGRGIRVGLWPREYADTHELLGGEQKTHELLFVFGAKESTTDRLRRRLETFHEPVYAMPDPRSALLSGAFPPSAPLDRGRYGSLEATCDIAVHPRGGSTETIQTRWEAIDEYGWRHFGDTFADNERAPPEMVKDFPEHHLGSQPISHFVNEYDGIHSVMLHGLRRREPAWMWMADVMARHHADICVYHTDVGAPAYAHGPFMHTTHDTAAYRSTFRAYPIEAKRYGLRYGQGGGPNAGHTYVTCLAQHWWLTGDRISRDAFLEAADWAADSPWFQKRMMGDQRGYGNFLATLGTAYRLTRDRKYHDRAMTLVSWIDEPFEGLGGTLFVKAAGRFLEMKREDGETDDDYRRVRKLLLEFGDLYLELPRSRWDRHLEQRCFHAEVLCTCYLHAPQEHPRREDYYRKGREILDGALDRFPGRYVPTKTWSMCFANTGAYLRAEKMHRAEEAFGRIRDFLEPPAGLAGETGSYASPLQLRDEQTVETPGDWRQRREEILEDWHSILGAWPPLIPRPKIERLETKRQESLTRYKVQVEVGPDDRMLDGYLLIPEDRGPLPAVIVVYYDPETGIGEGKELRDFGLQLARRGFVALSIGMSPWTPDRDEDTPQPLSLMAYYASNCCNALATLPEVDPGRIGIVGHSYGGKWAMFASCLYEKFACAAWSDGGIVFDEKRPNVNYWEPWYLGHERGRRRKPGVPTEDNPRTGAYRRLVEEGHDLHELHVLMAPRPFLVSGGSEDRIERWKPLNHSVAANRLLGYEHRVGLTTRKGHSPTRESNEQLYAFFEYFLEHEAWR